MPLLVPAVLKTYEKNQTKLDTSVLNITLILGNRLFNMVLLIRYQFLCVIFAIVSFWSYFQLMICESLRKEKLGRVRFGSAEDMRHRTKGDADLGKASDTHFTFALQMGYWEKKGTQGLMV